MYCEKCCFLIIGLTSTLVIQRPAGPFPGALAPFTDLLLNTIPVRETCMRITFLFTE